MEKIRIRVKNWSVYYDNIEYKPGCEMEIEKRFFRDDCMDEISDNNNNLSNEKKKSVEKNIVDIPLLIKDLKEFSLTKYGIELLKTKKIEVLEEANKKFLEKGLNLSEEINKYLNEENEVDHNEENI